mmetsp:Transcript_3357/g.5097  ORF Transcript_3357/g.5097 Transcript_3357/m.5097 type:complete len:614 (-) Transcript_3357:20-1861(-)|eukprot:CAMPEP_0194251674 /NCGR_PEP_ID=MMETSP0158-20130606/25914_1 /TAXON_ID=33649 /ORGANISM="Thalassionema nitzschioides, Strain L26-B" /LENGTH=613 /DNA_ID=CAMNT_0038988873 /DNA_START=135 /DNA_END=1976 /DNA_ORIENTATION=+
MIKTIICQSSNNIHHRRLLSAYASKLKVDPVTGVISHPSNGGDESLFQTIIGMEIHAQLDIPTKLFSGAAKVRKHFSQPPNCSLHPLDLAVPGFLPVLSKEAVHAAVLTAAAFQCDIQKISRFERKHYFYADLPLGYQMTQQRWPLARQGTLLCSRDSETSKKRTNKDDRDDQSNVLCAGIDRIQIEQDTGKTITVESSKGSKTTTMSLVDFDRAGCALVEIVFRPQIRSANDAALVVSTLRDLLRHIGTCDGRMEEGSLRCDLNLSIAPLTESLLEKSRDFETTKDYDEDDNPFQADLPLGTGQRVEVKNLNSIQQVRSAAMFEAQRQAEVFLFDEDPTKPETRTYDVSKQETVIIRTKGGAVDYRFLPEPDLPPLVLDPVILDGMSIDEFIKKKLPELPEATVLRLKEEYALPEDMSRVITKDPHAILLFEEAVGVARDTLGDTPAGQKIPITIGNWLCNDLYGLVKENSSESNQEEEASIKNSTVSGAQLGELAVMLEEGVISTPLGKKLLATLFEKEIGKNPRDVAEERGWKVVSNQDELLNLCRDVILAAENERFLALYKAGGKQRRKMTKLFMGKAMGASQGRADPQMLQDTLETVLEEIAPGTEPL